VRTWPVRYQSATFNTGFEGSADLPGQRAVSQNLFEIAAVKPSGSATPIQKI